MTGQRDDYQHHAGAGATGPASSLPGRDEVILSAPEAGSLCNSLACANAGRAADVIITFGTLADPDPDFDRHGKDALWASTSGRSYPMCAPCRDRTCEVLRPHRPHLAIREIGTDRG